MAEITILHKTVSEKADSLTIGSPTNGQVKVYGDFDKPAEFSAKIAKALALLEAAKEKMNGGA